MITRTKVIKPREPSSSVTVAMHDFKKFVQLSYEAYSEVTGHTCANTCFSVGYHEGVCAWSLGAIFAESAEVKQDPLGKMQESKSCDQKSD